MSPVTWIANNARGRSFCDIGGIGLNSLNERISVAVSNGASEATMIDYRKEDFPEWEWFRKKMSAAGIENFNEIDSANLEEAGFADRVGQYDFVHCTGIIYHSPSPLKMLDNLSRVTKQFLIVNTVIVPDVIENEEGRIEFPSGTVLFLPGMTEFQRAVLSRYYSELLGWEIERFSLFAPRLDDSNALMPWRQTRAASEKHFWGAHGDLSYSPYWWLFTRDSFRAAVRLFDFSIREEHSYKGHTLTLFCERPASQSVDK